MDRRLAGECPGFYPRMDEMRAPGRGVAGHQEADGHGGVGLGDMRALWRLGEVMALMLGAEIGENGEGGGLVESRAEESNGNVHGEERKEEEAAEERGAGAAQRGDGGDGREEVRCEGLGGEDV